jgi:ribosome-associated toxin RatA of RatAB toxin-antitoxin module
MKIHENASKYMENTWKYMEIHEIMKIHEHIEFKIPSVACEVLRMS